MYTQCFILQNSHSNMPCFKTVIFEIIYVHNLFEMIHIFNCTPLRCYAALWFNFLCWVMNVGVWFLIVLFCYVCYDIDSFFNSSFFFNLKPISKLSPLFYFLTHLHYFINMIKWLQLTCVRCLPNEQLVLRYEQRNTYIPY